MLLQTVFTRVDEKILSHVFVANVFANLTGMSVSFVTENLSCGFSLVNRSSKISGKLVSGPLFEKRTAAYSTAWELHSLLALARSIYHFSYTNRHALVASFQV